MGRCHPLPRQPTPFLIWPKPWWNFTSGALILNVGGGQCSVVSRQSIWARKTPVVRARADLLPAPACCLDIKSPPPLPAGPALKRDSGFGYCVHCL